MLSASLSLPSNSFIPDEFLPFDQHAYEILVEIDSDDYDPRTGEPINLKEPQRLSKNPKPEGKRESQRILENSKQSS